MSELLYFHGTMEGNILLLSPTDKPDSRLTFILSKEISEALRSLYSDTSNLKLLTHAHSGGDENRCWPIAEISRRTNIPLSTIRRWCAEDRVRYLRRGKAYWPHLDSVLAYAAETRTKIEFDGYLK